MKSILKFPLEMTSRQVLEMPVGGQVLTVKTENHPREQAFLWALVDTEAEKEERVVSIFKTGDIVTDAGDHIGSPQWNHGSHIFHVFIK